MTLFALPKPKKLLEEEEEEVVEERPPSENGEVVGVKEEEGLVLVEWDGGLGKRGRWRWRWRGWEVGEGERR